MSGAVKVVVGAVLVVVDFAFLHTGYLARIGAALLLNAASEALGPKPPRAPPLSGIDVAYSGTLEPRRLIYGQIKIGGTHGMPL